MPKVTNAEGDGFGTEYLPIGQHCNPPIYGFRHRVRVTHQEASPPSAEYPVCSLTPDYWIISRGRNTSRFKSCRNMCEI